MISKVYEWLRAADLQPDDQMVTTRTKAVQNLEKKIRDAKNYDLLQGTVTAAVGGCERLGEQSPVFVTILDCVRKQSPAFPSAIAENGLHLRMICCLGLGELLKDVEEEISDGAELLSASLLVSGLGLKPKEAGQHLDKVFEELGNVARTNLQRQAVAMRERVDLNWKEFDTLNDSVGDSTDFNQKLLSTVKGLFKNLQRQHELDREELEVIWWLYNGYSGQLGKQVKSMSSHLAATAIGAELADRVAPPSTTGLTELVSQAAVRDRSASQLKAKPIQRIVAELGQLGPKLMLPSVEHVRKFVRANGSQLPLSWLSLRLEESQGADGWEAELLSRTGLSSALELTPGELASQVFVERQTQQVYQSLVKRTA